MFKEILFKEKAREKIITGVNIVADAVVSTLGPKGQNVIFEESVYPTITKDGVTVAQQIMLEDKFENMGVMVAREAAENTNREAGDGTTSTISILRAIVNEGNKYIATGMNPILLKRGMDEAEKDINSVLAQFSKTIETRKSKEFVATISANNDPEIGKMIVDVLEKVGQDGIVSVTNSSSLKTEIEYVKGTRIHSGLLSPYFINDRKKLSAEISNVAVVITTDRIEMQGQLINIIQSLVEAGKTKILLLAPSIEGTAMAFLTQNHLAGKFTCIPVTIPIFGEYQRDLILDIAALTKTTVVGEEEAIKLSDATADECGKAGHVSVGLDQTVLTNGAGSVKDRIVEAKELLSKEKDLFKREQIKKRLGRLNGSVANIRVGGASETEQTEIRYRIEDALHATKAAIEDGIVEGGGVALMRVANSISPKKNKSKEFEAGYEIVLKAIQIPARTILDNAGLPSDAILSKIKDGSKGYNVLTDTYEDFFKIGVVDPLRCVKNEVTNAVATASILLTSNVAIANKEIKNKE